MLPLDVLVKKITVEQAKATAFSILETLGFPVASWAPVSVIRTIVVLFCRLVAPLSDAAALIAASGFLDYATGGSLTLLAEQVYNVVRRPASFASGSVTLSNAAGGSYTYAPFTFRVLNPTTRKAYVNTASFTLAPLQVGLVVPVQAVEVGAGSTSAAATITQLETVLVGVTVTNAAAVIGVDAETDAEVRVRCRAKLGALSPNGPAAAYDFVARSADLNGGVVITRTLPVEDSATGDVTLYVAGPTGPVTGPDVALVQAAVHRLAQPLCIDATVVSATAYVLNITCTVYVYTTENLSNAAVQALVLARLTEYIPTIPIGGHKAPTAGVYTDALKGEIKAAGTTDSVLRGPIHQVTLAVPAANVTLAVDEVVTLGTVTTNVVQVVPPGAA